MTLNDQDRYDPDGEDDKKPCGLGCKALNIATLSHCCCRHYSLGSWNIGSLPTVVIRSKRTILARSFDL